MLFFDFGVYGNYYYFEKVLHALSVSINVIDVHRENDKILFDFSDVDLLKFKGIFVSFPSIL